MIEDLIGVAVGAGVSWVSMIIAWRISDGVWVWQLNRKESD